jgi:hypothetical protein
MNGNLKYLSEAEVFVDTVFSIESGAGSGNRFYLADYTTMDEFTTDCGSWFEEENPEYVYSEWWGIPDLLINERWLCPSIFEIRDAIQMLDRDTIGSFSRWCTDNGHDIRADDPMMLVTRYQDHVPPAFDVVVAINSGSGMFEVYCLDGDDSVVSRRDDVCLNELVGVIDTLVEKNCPDEEYDIKRRQWLAGKSITVQKT